MEQGIHKIKFKIIKLSYNLIGICPLKEKNELNTYLGAGNLA